tara:strand:+ start:19 stop:225 length:207 start_codon:yes stop_codon:yes gene_type:complete
MADMTFEEMNEEIREEIYEDVIQEFEYLNSYILNDTEKQNIISDIVDCILRERQSQPPCECAAYGGTN